MYKYSILTYNFGGYEILHEIDNPQDDVEYIYVTDDKNITSTTWKIIVEEYGDSFSIFDKCYWVRFNPWKYVSTDICIRLDGSMHITGSFDTLIDKFNSANYDCAVILHPFRNILIDEYKKWIEWRQYPVSEANKCIHFIYKYGLLDPSKRTGLIEQNFVIQRKNRVNFEIDEYTYQWLKMLGDNNTIQRLDQPITTVVLQRMQNIPNILFLSEDVVVDGKYCVWCKHGSNEPASSITNGEYRDTAIWKEKIVNLYK